jgi:signal transduction histidine kinase
MQSVTAKGLDQRIALGQEDAEFRQLIQVFNSMLERLERSFLQASRFSADAAHELKTPLAILQGQIERAMGLCEAGSPLQTSLTSILDEVQRLGTISRKLLLLSLADAGRLRLHITRVDLSAALEDLLEDAQMLAPQLTVTGAITPGLIVQADAELLRQVLHNLISNAIKYNAAPGWIRIAATRVKGRVEIAVSNSSAGIPTADRERIFERFYRADPAHNRQIEGVGLGLSLSREIARAHGGDLRLAASPAGEVRFVLGLPA